METVRVLFIHHSTGGLLLREGNVRHLLDQKAPFIKLWDHGYNIRKGVPHFLAGFTYHTGLSDADGRMTGVDYRISLSNNSPKEYDEIFSRDPEADTTLHEILKYDVIVFKNCYPTTRIESDQKLKELKNHYLHIRKSLKKYEWKLFILMTPPPLRKEMTKPEYAARAHELCSWLSSEEFCEGMHNIAVFDFFHALADKTGPNAYMLRRKYCHVIPFDSHPNRRANREVALLFATFLAETVLAFGD